VQWDCIGKYAVSLSLPHHNRHTTDMMTLAGGIGAGISVKDEDIKQLYGAEATREAVLAGQVQPPPAATRLYAALNRLSFFAANAAAP
jgi:hypothetical protein